MMIYINPAFKTNKNNKMPQRIPDQRETGSGGVNLENDLWMVYLPVYPK
jgi:hypothetical protein